MQLTPVEFKYVSSPIFVKGHDLLKLTLQHLYLNGVIAIEQKLIQIHPREKLKRRHFFFSKGPSFEQYETNKKSERFLLELLLKRNSFRLYELRQHLDENMGLRVFSDFKTDYVARDIAKSGLLYLQYLPKLDAWKKKNQIKAKLALIEKTVDILIEDNYDQLSQLLFDIGPNILLLNSETISKIQAVAADIHRIVDLRFLDHMDKNFTAFHNLSIVDSLALSSGFSGISVGGFSDGGTSGIGGGSFGGGGAGGSW